MKNLFKSTLLLVALVLAYLMLFRPLKTKVVDMFPLTPFYLNKPEKITVQKSSRISWRIEMDGVTDTWYLRLPFGTYYLIAFSFYPYLNHRIYFISVLSATGLTIFLFQILFVSVLPMNMITLYILDWLSNEADMLLSLGVGPVFLVYEKYRASLVQTGGS